MFSKLFKRGRTKSAAPTETLLHRSASTTSLQSFEGSIDLNDPSQSQESFLKMKIKGLEELVQIRENQCHKKDVRIEELEEQTTRNENLENQLKIQNTEVEDLKRKLKSMQDQQKKTDTIERMERMVRFLARDKGYDTEKVPEPIRSITEKMEKLIGEDWFKLGIELGINFETLHRIRESSGSSKRKFQMLIADWTREKEDWDASGLVKALQSIDKDPLSDRPPSVCELKVLERSRPFLFNNLSETCVKRICDQLFSRRLISHDTLSAILKQQDLSWKIFKLLHCLEQCPEGTLDIFSEILKECGNAFIADKLMDESSPVDGEALMTSVHDPVRAPAQETGGRPSRNLHPHHSIHGEQTNGQQDPRVETQSRDEQTQDIHSLQECHPDENSLDEESTHSSDGQTLATCTVLSDQPLIDSTEYQNTGLETYETDVPLPNEAELCHTEGVRDHGLEIEDSTIQTDEKFESGRPTKSQESEMSFQEMPASWTQTNDVRPMAEWLTNMIKLVQTCSHPMTIPESLECKVFMKLFFLFVKMVQLCLPRMSETFLHSSANNSSKLSTCHFQPDIKHTTSTHVSSVQERQLHQETRVSGDHAAITGLKQMYTPTDSLKTRDYETKDGSICLVETLESVVQGFPCTVSNWQMQLELKSITEVLLAHIGTDAADGSGSGVVEVEVEAQCKIIINSLVNYITFLCDNDNILEDKSSQLEKLLLLLKDLLPGDAHTRDYWIFSKPKGNIVHI